MSRPLVVLHSLPGVRPTTNPYLVMLREGLRHDRDVTLLDFSYRHAFLRRFDVFHVHWPEILLDGRTPLRKAARQLLLALFLLRLQLLKVPIVRTVHNVERPTGLRAHEHWLLSRVDRLTTLCITLNDHTDSLAGQPVRVIPHGHYRSWYAAQPKPEATPGRLGFVGMIRRYKGVEQLIAAFRATRDHDAGGLLSLSVAGRPTSTELADQVRASCEDDDRIELDLQFLSDQEFVSSVSKSELIVLPYRFMHNSGGAIAALSLDRPVLVPDNAVNRDLEAEVGPGWLIRFDRELDADTLLTAWQQVRSADRSARPDLSARDWDHVAGQHVQAYREAIRARKL